MTRVVAAGYTAGRMSLRNEKQFNVRLTDDERALLEAERLRLGLRHTSDVIRLWISAIAVRERAQQRDTKSQRKTVAA